MNGAEGLLGLASAFQGFAKGVQDGEDRNYKRMEMEAKLEAQKQDRERQRMMDAITMRKEHVQQNEFGELVDAPLSEAEIAKTKHDDLVQNGYNSTYDPVSRTWNSKVDNDSLKAKILANRSMSAKEGVDIRKDALDRREHERTLTRLANNKNVRERLTQYQNLDNALSAITQSDHVTPQQIHEFQQAIRGNLGIKGSSGVGEREETYFKSLGLNAANIQQFLTGDPASLAKDSSMIKHLQNLAQVEQANIKRQFDRSLNAATAGHASLYQRRPDLFADLQDAMNAQGDQLQSINETAPAQGLVAPNEAGGNGLLSQGAGLVKRMFMGREKQASPQYEADVLKYAKDNNITPEAAQAIKLKRTGGKP